MLSTSYVTTRPKGLSLVKQVLHSQDVESDASETPTFSSLKPDNLIGHTLLTIPTKGGQCFCACIVHCIVIHLLIKA